MTEDAASDGLPTAMGFAAKHTIDALRRRNVATAPVLRDAAILGARPRGERSGPSSHIGGGTKPAARLRRGSDRGRRFRSSPGRAGRSRNAGIFFYVASAAESLGEALALMRRYCRIANEAVRVKLTTTPVGLVVEIGFVGVPRPLGRQWSEFLMAVTLRVCASSLAVTSA